VNLTPHFTLEEAETTSHRNLDNSIPNGLIGAVLKTAEKMEIVREILGKPIHINSWYRSPQVNVAVGGTMRSQHSKGEAVDFICPAFGTPILVVKELVKHTKKLDFDQLIYEHSWVHISFAHTPGAKQRNQVLTLLRNKKYAVGITDKEGNPQ
jgi:hypothetical protein